MVNGATIDIIKFIIGDKRSIGSFLPVRDFQKIIESSAKTRTLTLKDKGFRA